MITDGSDFASLVRSLDGATDADLAFRVARDPRLRAAARGARERLVARIQRELGPFDPRHLRAILEVPRERFVRPRDLARACDDVPLPLDESALATISAPHAYLLSFRLLELAPGERCVELGSGYGYGAALASFIVGAQGSVLTIEIDEQLAARASSLLAGAPNVRALCMDAVASAPAWGPASRVVATFAVRSLPPPWLDALAPDGRLVAPVGPPEADQRLVLARRGPRGVAVTDHGGVRYVPNRGAE